LSRVLSAMVTITVRPVSSLHYHCNTSNITALSLHRSLPLPARTTPSVSSMRPSVSGDSPSRYPDQLLSNTITLLPYIMTVYWPEFV
jgi:hypothetical protein